MTRTQFLTLALLGGAILPACWSQSQSLPAPLDFTRSNAEGLHIYSISSYFGYTAFKYPESSSGLSSLPSRKAYGVSGTVGWQRLRGRTSFSFRYTGSYSGITGIGKWSGANHNGAFTLARPLGRKWTLDLSANAQDTFFEQFLFDPTYLASLAQTPATFDNLAASMSVGQYTNSQSSVLLNASTVSASAMQTALLGSHIYTYGARAGVAYAPSSRLSIRFGSFALGGQHRTGDSNTGPQANYVMPRSTGGDAEVSIAFLASPRTSFDFNVTESYLSSKFQNSLGTSATAGLGRKMGRHWFLRGYAGSYIPERLSGGGRKRAQTIGGASLGLTTYGNTFLASYNRSGYDLTLGTAGVNTTVTAAWNWRRPRNNWGLSAAYSRTVSSGSGISSLTGWQATAGLTERLPANLYLSVMYSHVSSRGMYLNLADHIVVDGARITVGWAPERRRSEPTVIAPEEESK